MTDADTTTIPAKVSETSIFRRIETTIAAAFHYREPCLIVGPPGIGKTTALNEIARRHEAIIFITATAANGAKSSFFKLLADHISERNRHFRRPAKQSLHDLFSMLSGVLADYMPLDTAIMIDEAQNLNFDAMRLLLDLNDQVKTPIAFVGNPHTLKSTKANQEALNQIWDRVSGHRFEFRGLGTGDVIAIAVDHNVEGVDAYGYLEAFAMKNSSLRRLAGLLREARTSAGPQGSIRLPHLRKAVAVLHSEDEDRGLFKLVPKPRKEENAA